MLSLNTVYVRVPTPPSPQLSGSFVQEIWTPVAEQRFGSTAVLLTRPVGARQHGARPVFRLGSQTNARRPVTETSSTPKPP
jgi:hypothetical protein